MNQRSLWKKVSFAVSSAVVSVSLFTGCASRSPVASQIINIPPQYSDKMNNMLDATGYQQGLIVDNQFSHYNKAIVSVQLSSPMIENSTLDYLNPSYLAYNDNDVRSTIIDYAQNSFYYAFGGSRYFGSTNQSGPGVLKINVYITQVVPNDAVFGTLGNIPSPTWLISKPIGMGIHDISSSGGGAVAMEIVISDSLSGKVLAVFADREKDAYALFNTNGFTMTGSGKDIIDLWSLDLVSTLDQLKSGSTDLTASKIAPLLNFVQ